MRRLTRRNLISDAEHSANARALLQHVASVRTWRGGAYGFALYAVGGWIWGAHDGGGAIVFGVFAALAYNCAPVATPELHRTADLYTPPD